MEKVAKYSFKDKDFPKYNTIHNTQVMDGDCFKVKHKSTFCHKRYKAHHNLDIVRIQVHIKLDLPRHFSYMFLEGNI